MVLPGCSSSQRTDFVLGAVLPLSGQLADFGVSARKGIELAVAEMNAAGGIRGRRLRVEYEDTEGQPTAGVEAFHKLVTRHQVTAVVGALLSSTTLAMAPLAQQSRVVLLSPTSSAPDVPGSSAFVFSIAQPDAHQVLTLAAYAYNSLSLRRVGLLAVGDGFELRLGDVFAGAFQDLGGAVVGIELAGAGSIDWRGQIARLQSASPDALFFVGHAEAAYALSQAAELDVDLTFLGTELFAEPEMLEIAGGAAEGLVYPDARAVPTSREGTAFAQAYVAEYGQAPDLFAALSYDSAKLVGAAAATGLTGDEIREGLLTLKTYVGAAGIARFTEGGGVVRPVPIMMIQDGDPVVVEVVDP